MNAAEVELIRAGRGLDAVRAYRDRTACSIGMAALAKRRVEAQLRGERRARHRH